MARLTIISPEGRQEAELQAHNTLGRHPNNTVQVLDRIVSKEHCHVDFVDGRFVLRDLGSLNGTFVNGERVSERVLNPGDEITLGSTRILFDGEVALRAGRPIPPGYGIGPQGAFSPAPIPQQPMGSGPPVPVPFSPQNSPPPVVPVGPYAQPPVMPPSLGGTTPFGPPNRPANPSSPPSAHSSQPGAPRPMAPLPNLASAAGASVGGLSAQGLSAQGLSVQGLPMRPPSELSKVTIAPGMVESHIRTRLGMEQNFLPEKLVTDLDSLRRDYEKLRVSYELARAIGAELDIQKVLDRILAAAFQILQADRGIVLLYNDDKKLEPRAVRTRAGTQDPNEPVLVSSTIIEQVASSRQAVLSSDATVDSRFGGAHSIIMQGIRSSMAVPLLHSDQLFGIMLLDSQIATNAFTEKDLQIFQNVANQAAISVQNSLYAKKLEAEAITRERFQRLLSPAIAQQVLEGKVAIQKGGEGRQTTVLFSDIRGFTSMSESENPQVIVDMLNEYFELMVEVIFKYEGTLDKFVGDEIMALFGAPVSHGDDAVRAVRTAIEMLEVLRELNAARARAGAPEIRIGIGINTGHVVAGYIGSSKALEYTVIGDTVNTGARLCSVAKAGEIIISQSTYEQIGDRFDVIELPPVQVKGKSQALKIYNVIGEKRGSFGSERTRPA
ncbi:MAG: GAF domain-containing protein [Sandaracinaceae bacterium]|nr:GAF domain-containing protein [Sandaracinaceae bacterium]